MQRYRFGHKPKHIKPDRAVAEANAREGERKLLDYRSALQRANLELRQTEEKIDDLYEQISELRAKIEPLQKNAGQLAARHLVLRGTIECLDGLVNGSEVKIVEALQ